MNLWNGNVLDWDTMAGQESSVNAMLYLYDKRKYLLSVICYLYYEVHWFCFWVGDYPLSVWLLNPSIIPFSLRYRSVGACQVSCYLMLIYVKL